MNKPRRTEAVVFADEGKVVVEEVALPETGPEDVLVENEYSSISTGTERWCLLAKHHPPGEKPPPFPFVPGYQAAGVVTEVGKDAKDIAPGDRVFSPRGRLAEGGPGLCWGGHMHHHVTHHGSVMKLPDSVSTREASGLLLAQVGYNGATQPRVNKGDVVVVIGDGLVGQYGAQIFRHRGATVILSGHHDERLKIASQYCADEVVNSKRDDFPAYVRAKCPDGVQVAAESASKNVLIQQAIELLEYNGQLVLLGYYPEGECLIDIHWVRARETTIYCPNSSMPERMENSLALIEQGHFHVEELITHEFPAARAPEAYQMTLDKGTEFLGIVLNWTES